MTSIQNPQAPQGRGWLVFLGIVMLLTGIAALVFPLVASLSVELLIGCAFAVGGVATLIQALSEKEWGGVFWQLLVGVVYLAGGIIFLLDPFGGVLALTVIVAAVFVAEGVLRIVLAFKLRGEPRWGLLAAAGGISILLGVLVFAGLASGASLGVIGALLGVNFIFAGVSFLALGSQSTSDASDHQAA